MKKILLSLLSCLAALTMQAQVRNIGRIDITVDAKVTTVQVSANTPDLDALARKAFAAHGAYSLSASQGQYVIKFSKLSATQVRVDVTRGGSNDVVVSQVCNGTSARNALLKAADVAVEKTNQQGLKGFFASKLAFLSDRGGVQQVCIGDLFFGEVKQLTNDKGHSMSPRWHPDGSRIIYTSYYKSGFPDIFQIDTRTFQRITFASYKGTNGSGRFSPDGRSVAAVMSSPGNPEVFIGSSNGKNFNRVTKTDAVESSPCFSPDSSRIVYVSDMAGGPQLYVMSVHGGSPQRLSTGLSRYCAEPDWSRNNKIAFTAGFGKGYQIAVYEMGAGTAKQVSKASFDAIEPSWLADGRHVVYTARDRRESRICILDTESGKSTIISGTELGLCSQSSVLNP